MPPGNHYSYEKYYATGATGTGSNPEAHIFDQKTKYRSCKVFVEDHPLYVSPHFLAHISPFFEFLLFEDFPNVHRGVVELKNVEYNRFFDFLLVMGADTTREAKRIDEHNCASLLLLSRQWDVASLRCRCLAFLSSTFNRSQASFPCTLEILKACETTKVDGVPLINVAKRLASFGQQQLLLEGVYSQILNPQLSAGISEAASSLENMRPHGNMKKVKEMECDRAWCENTTKKRCGRCGFSLCDVHLGDPCFNQTTHEGHQGEKNKEYKYTEVMHRDDYVKVDLS